MSKNVKFGLLIALILGTVGCLAAVGIHRAASYYKEIAELRRMGSDSAGMRLQVAGEVLPNSIFRDEDKVHFTLVQNGSELHVIYSGSDSLPDTFVSGSRVLADGEMDTRGVFHATKLLSQRVQPNTIARASKR